MTDLNAALDAMRDDATVWATAADSLEAPRDEVTELPLSGAEMSMWAADLGLDRTYNEARAKVETVLSQAVAGFRELAVGLRAAADTYQREEEANLHSFNRLDR
ncbi:hypothetical protein FHS29_007007 [Saccharothrix tamanrassetensis]|uniref:Excreted virulence factor EspC (Type VII ESX diderm) n=1 Tax=Saccharothrix tamanrassetensis TaxID=1051531 RepID=A0A841CVP7_9PSEU|nr:hypothetical protein [Saccharothrix tamanrassetensis]MBB5960384.1 hypothetical protein [Saccharothrix tamanrassetensis]